MKLSQFTEAKKLNDYSEALQGNPLYMQLDKMTAVKSPETLRRFLSSNAPDELVSRYSFRLSEVMAEMSSYEMGRVQFLKGDMEEAKVLLSKAYDQEKDKRACYLLGVIYYHEERYGIALNLFNKAIERGVNVEESMIYKGLYLLQAVGDKERARDYFRSILSRLSPGKTNFVVGMLKAIDGEDEFAQNEWVDGLARGDVFSALELLAHLEQEGNVSKICVVLNRLIRLGYVSRYLQLGEIHENFGQSNLAEECYLSAVQAGIKEGYTYLVRMNIRRKRADDAMAYAQKALGEDFHEIYVPLVELLIDQKKFSEAYSYLNQMFEVGMEREAEQILNLVAASSIFTAIRNEMIEAMKKGEMVNDNFAHRVLGRVNNRDKFGNPALQERSKMLN